jgi:hypothetical protein
MLLRFSIPCRPEYRTAGIKKSDRSGILARCGQRAIPDLGVAFFKWHSASRRAGGERAKRKRRSEAFRAFLISRGRPAAERLGMGLCRLRGLLSAPSQWCQFHSLPVVFPCAPAIALGSLPPVLRRSIFYHTYIIPCKTWINFLIYKTLQSNLPR